MKERSVKFPDGVELFTYGDISEEIRRRYNPCHYEVWRNPSGDGNLAKDNIHTLKVPKLIKERLLKRFRITKEDTVLELGAYNGWGTVRLSKLAKRVVAVEASPSNADLVEKNLIHNNIENVECLNIAAGENVDKLMFYEAEHQQAKSFYPKVLQSHNIISKREIIISPLDLFVNDIDYVTMEINNSEYSALKGMERLLQGDLRLIISGWYSHLEEMCKFLEGFGYTTYIGKVKRIYALKWDD